MSIAVLYYKLPQTLNSRPSNDAEASSSVRKIRSLNFSSMKKSFSFHSLTNSHHPMVPELSRSYFSATICRSSPKALKSLFIAIWNCKVEISSFPRPTRLFSAVKVCRKNSKSKVIRLGTNTRSSFPIPTPKYRRRLNLLCKEK